MFSSLSFRIYHGFVPDKHDLGNPEHLAGLLFLVIQRSFILRVVLVVSVITLDWATELTLI